MSEGTEDRGSPRRPEARRDRRYLRDVGASRYGKGPNALIDRFALPKDRNALVDCAAMPCGTGSDEKRAWRALEHIARSSKGLRALDAAKYVN